MKMILLMMLLTSIVYGDNCLQKAQTRSDMNQCAGVTLKSAEKELAAVYEQLKVLYKDDAAFLKQLKHSQKVFIEMMKADFKLKYPHADDPRYYGSIFGMCAASYRKEMIVARIAFLKQWVKGGEEGDACSGSLKNSDDLPARTVAKKRGFKEMITALYPDYNVNYRMIQGKGDLIRVEHISLKQKRSAGKQGRVYYRFGVKLFQFKDGKAAKQYLTQQKTSLKKLDKESRGKAARKYLYLDGDRVYLLRDIYTANGTLPDRLFKKLLKEVAPDGVKPFSVLKRRGRCNPEREHCY